jgi:hypothetical protein
MPHPKVCPRCGGSRNRRPSWGFVRQRTIPKGKPFSVTARSRVPQGFFAHPVPTLLNPRIQETDTDWGKVHIGKRFSHLFTRARLTCSGMWKSEGVVLNSYQVVVVDRKSGSHRESDFPKLTSFPRPSPAKMPVLPFSTRCPLGLRRN